MEEAWEYPAVSGDLDLVIFLIGFGLVLAIHCPRAAYREYRSGIAEGFDRHPRTESPGLFWVTIGFTFMAGVMGLAFIVFGIGFAISRSVI